MSNTECNLFIVIVISLLKFLASLIRPFLNLPTIWHCTVKNLSKIYIYIVLSRHYMNEIHVFFLSLFFFVFFPPFSCKMSAEGQYRRNVRTVIEYKSYLKSQKERLTLKETKDKWVVAHSVKTLYSSCNQYPMLSASIYIHIYMTSTPYFFVFSDHWATITGKSLWPLRD